MKITQGVVRAVDFACVGLAQNLLPILFRLATLYVFLWYLVEFFCELHIRHCVLAWSLVVLAAVATILTGLKVYPEFDCKKDPGATRISAFLLLNLPPVLIVAIATWYGYMFTTGTLLPLTQMALKGIAAAFR